MLRILTIFRIVFHFFGQHKEPGVEEPTKKKDKERRGECNTERD